MASRKVQKQPNEGLPRPDHAGAEKLFGDGKLAATFVEIKPATALALLERNAQNRSVSGERVQMYARDIEAGAWEVNSQGIGLGADGKLLDGQHRLWAIIKAGKAATLLVVRGLPVAARATIDRGKTRSVADLLRILDGTTGAARMISWVRTIEALHDTRTQFSVNTVRAKLSAYEVALDWMLSSTPKLKPYGVASILGAFVYARHAVGADVDVILERYASGVGLESGSAILALRSFVVERLPQARARPRGNALRTLHAIASELQKISVEKLVESEESFAFFKRHATGTPA